MSMDIWSHATEQLNENKRKRPSARETFIKITTLILPWNFLGPSKSRYEAIRIRPRVNMQTALMVSDEHHLLFEDWQLIRLF
jgi:hypothetical protein